jgi:hypothetical protein
MVPLTFKSTLTNLSYQQLRHEECVFYIGSTIFFIYTDDNVFLDHNKTILQERLNQLQSAFKIDLQGDLNKHLGIMIDRHANSTIHPSQPQLIDSILVNLKFLD